MGIALSGTLLATKDSLEDMVNLYRPTPGSHPGASNAADAVRLRRQLASEGR